MSVSFDAPLSADHQAALEVLAKKSRLDAMKMIQRAKSGHIGGSFSAMEILSVLWSCKASQDEIIASIGHVAAGAYAVLGNLGVIDLDAAINGFRSSDVYEGLMSTKIPGVNWCNGILGQGLSQGCGVALSKLRRKEPGAVYVLMGDGEQGKGQLQEAREFAAKYDLTNLVAIIDCNDMQSSGPLRAVLPQNLPGKYALSGWRVTEIDGNDIAAVHQALREAQGPEVILAHTVMGKGLPFIEGDYRYHGTVLSSEQYEQGLKLLNTGEIEARRILAIRPERFMDAGTAEDVSNIDTGQRRVYGADEALDCRTAFGKALVDVAGRNEDVLVTDCDLVDSVKLKGVTAIDRLIECGIAEQNACSMAAGMSKHGVVAVSAGFAVFSIAECYAQLRVADLNGARLKVFGTHAGLDVGEDGKTHQMLEYLSLLSNFRNCKTMVCADPNQTDAITRYSLSIPGFTAVVMGRSKVEALTDDKGEILFGMNYCFEYGKADWIKRGGDGCIVTLGTTVSRALCAARRLRQYGLDIAVLNVSCPFELDEQKLMQAANTGFVLAYEDHWQRGGLGSMVDNFTCSVARAAGSYARALISTERRRRRKRTTGCRDWMWTASRR